MSGLLTPDDIMAWGRHTGGSPLYSRLIELIASDDELMRVLNRIENRPQPNVLLAGVQYLLMRDPTQPLARHYPNLSDDLSPVEGVDGPFREFVLGHETELVDIGRTRHTQTNEARRCAALLPAIWETPAIEFHLIDIGTSAGLNLLIDRYSYRWDSVEWGPGSAIVLECALRGRVPAPRSIEVLSRTGLDLNPVDPGDSDDRMWLESLIWPEQTDRLRRLQAAIDVYGRETVEMIAGDATETLGVALDGLSGDDEVVVMHSFALNQFDEEQRHAVDDEISKARLRRPIWRVGMELLDWSDEAATLTVDEGSGPRVIGRAQPHGEWIELYARP